MALVRIGFGFRYFAAKRIMYRMINDCRSSVRPQNPIDSESINFVISNIDWEIQKDQYF